MSAFSTAAHTTFRILVVHVMRLGESIDVRLFVASSLFLVLRRSCSISAGGDSFGGVRSRTVVARESPHLSLSRNYPPRRGAIFGTARYDNNFFPLDRTVTVLYHIRVHYHYHMSIHYKQLSLSSWMSHQMIGSVPRCVSIRTKKKKELNKC